MAGRPARLAVGLAVGLAVAVALAGCSGSGPAAQPAATAASPTTTAPMPVVVPPDRRGFVAAANARCDRATTDLRSLGAPSDAAAVDEALTASVRIAASLLADLRALPQPPSAAAALRDQFYAPLQAEVDAVRPIAADFHAAVRAGKPPAELQRIASRLAAVPDRTPSVVAFLDSFGLDACAGFVQAAPGGGAGGA